MFEQFIESLRQSGKSYLTIRQYRSSWMRFIGWLRSEGGYTMGTGVSPEGQNATQLDIANFKKWATKNYKPRTVSLNLIHLSVYCRWLVERNIIPDNPCDHVDNVTVQQEAPEWLSRNEQNALIRAVRKHGNLREMTIITLLLHTGLRVQELCDLQMIDVELSDRKGKIIVQQGKGGKYREVPLNLDARKSLEDYLKERKADSLYLFTT